MSLFKLYRSMPLYIWKLVGVNNELFVIDVLVTVEVVVVLLLLVVVLLFVVFVLLVFVLFVLLLLLLLMVEEALVETKTGRAKAKTFP